MIKRAPAICWAYAFGFIFFPLFLSAQAPVSNDLFYSVNFRTGENTPHCDVIRNLKYPYRGVEFKLGWQTNGKNYWQQAYRYPLLGVGLNWNTFRSEVLGDPYALYFFANFPQLRWGILRFDIETDLGVAYGVHPFDPVTNQGNMATGSAANIFFGFYFEQTLFSHNDLQFFVSEGISHYSNAALGFPNLGLNIPSVKVGVRFQPHISEFKHDEVSKSVKQWSVMSMLGGGFKKLDEPNPLYIEISFCQTLYRQPVYKHKYGIGYEVAYNEARKVRSLFADSSNVDFSDLITGSVFLSHEFVIERFYILTQFGFYIYQQPTDKFYFERVGVGYNLGPGVRVGLNLKAHYFKAEYLEFCAAYELCW